MESEITNYYKIAEFDRRPWGEWVVLDSGEAFVVKKITINPGCRLSLQYHNFREETWTIVSGHGLASVGQSHLNVHDGDIVEIPLNTVHRMTNKSETTPLVMIEVQKGTALDENDVVRIEDDYGRVIVSNSANAR